MRLTPSVKTREAPGQRNAWLWGSPCADEFPAGGRRPWEVARWGRLLTGLSVLTFTLLGLFHHNGWLAGSIFASANLILTSLTDRCALRDLLLRLGAKEREDLFLPGGALRTGFAAPAVDAQGGRSFHSKGETPC